MFDPGPEERLLLLLSRKALSLSAIEEARSVISGGIDSGRFVRLAARHDVAPLVYLNARSIGGIDEQAARSLKASYLASSGINLRNAKEGLRLMEIFRNEDISAIPLKGPFTSLAVYEDPGIHPSSDIDFLLKPQDMDRASELVRQNGYQPLNPSENDMRSAHYHLAFEKTPYFVELHWKLSKRYYDVPPEFWWEETGTSMYEGHRIPTLSPERLFMALAFRAMSHEYEKLKFLTLPAALLETGMVDSGKLLRLSAHQGMLSLVIFTIRLLHDLLGAAVPEDIKHTHTPLYRTLRGAVLEDLFIEKRRSYRKVLYMLLMDSSSASLKALAGRLFPSSGELRLRYDIPEGSHRLWIYYLLNPFILSWMILRRRRNP